MVCIGSVCMKPHTRASSPTGPNELTTAVGSKKGTCGICEHGSCNGTECICNFGWSGPNCSAALDCSAVGGCGQHGICTLGGICECDVRWSGPNCSIGSCPYNCSSHGQCDTSRAECICDYLWVGRACQRRACIANCTGMGECVDGVCNCLQGYADPSKAPSEEDCSACLNLCSGHGDCDKATRRCLCSPWYTGVDCSFAICPNGCSGHGSCGLDGNCICDAGWSSYACDVSTCPADCSGHGTCSGGSCLCQSGYGGPTCAAAPSTAYAPPAACLDLDGIVCAGHGSCDTESSLNGTAACVCDAGWGQPLCNWRSGCIGNCSGHGTCISTNVGSGDIDENGTCACLPEWSGSDCSTSSPFAAADTAAICPSGPESPGGPMAPCSGRGSCVAGICYCDPGFVGIDCAVVSGQIAAGPCNATCIGTHLSPYPGDIRISRDCINASMILVSHTHSDLIPSVSPAYCKSFTVLASERDIPPQNSA